MVTKNRLLPCRHCVILIYFSLTYNLYYPSYNEGSWVIVAVFDAFFVCYLLCEGDAGDFNYFLLDKR